MPSSSKVPQAPEVKEEVEVSDKGRSLSNKNLGRPADSGPGEDTSAHAVHHQSRYASTKNSAVSVSGTAVP